MLLFADLPEVVAPIDADKLRLRLGERSYVVRKGRFKGCWNSTFRRDCNGTGYPEIGIGGRLRGVHRVAYERFCGPIPAGVFVLHSCDNRRCWKPDHLFLGSQADNIADMIAKGRQHGGVNAPNGVHPRYQFRRRRSGQCPVQLSFFDLL